jgi:hypothetical protein
MAANDNATVTFDTNEFVYTDKGGMTTHTVTNGQTIVLDLTAAGTGTNYRMMDGKTITCTDGTNLTFEADPAFTWFHVPTDATSAINAGSIRIYEDDGTPTDWNVSEITIDDVDEPTEITTCTLEAKNEAGQRTITLSAITVAQ